MNDITIRQFQEDSHRIAREHGFWEQMDIIARDHPDGIPIVLDSKLMLITGEVAEAEDALRHDKGNEAVGEELADIMIRVADLAEWMGIDLTNAIQSKQAYNETRPHKHGKRF